MEIIGNILFVFIGGFGLLAVFLAVVDAIIRQIEGEKLGGEDVEDIEGLEVLKVE